MKYHISLLASPFKTFSCHSAHISRLLFQKCYTFKCNLLAWIFSLYLRPRCQIYCVHLRDGAPKKMAEVSLKGRFIRQGNWNHTVLFFFFVCLRECEVNGFSRVCGLISQRILLRCLKWLFPCRLCKVPTLFPFYFFRDFEVSSVSSFTKLSFHVRHYAWSPHETKLSDSDVRCYMLFYVFDEQPWLLPWYKKIFFFPSLIFPFSPAPWRRFLVDSHWVTQRWNYLCETLVITITST